MKKDNKSGAGFTIIELIVVIAIIAVLAAIVLVSVTIYISKGRDSAIKSNMGTIVTNAAVWFDNNDSTFTGFDTDVSYTAPAIAITNAGKNVTPATTVDGSAFCACTTLNDTTNGTFCVESTGYKNQTNTDCVIRCEATAATCSD